MIKIPVAKLIFTATVLLSLAMPMQAQTKTGIINLKKVFDSYWKTKQADSQLKERAGEFDKQRKELIDGYQKANEEYQKLLEGANDQTLSTDEKEKRKKSAESKLREIKEIETQVTQFDRTARTTLSEQQRRMRDAILREIQDIISTKSKAAGYTMVWDSAAESANNTPILIYHNGENDISDEVLTQLNANAPAEFLKPAAEKSPEAKPTKDDKEKK
jgi:outer membrane protein